MPTGTWSPAAAPATAGCWASSVAARKPKPSSARGDPHVRGRAPPHGAGRAGQAGRPASPPGTSAGSPPTAPSGCGLAGRRPTGGGASDRLGGAWASRALAGRLAARARGDRPSDEVAALLLLALASRALRRGGRGRSSTPSPGERSDGGRHGPGDRRALAGQGSARGGQGSWRTRPWPTGRGSSSTSRLGTSSTEPAQGSNWEPCYGGWASTRGYPRGAASPRDAGTPWSPHDHRGSDWPRAASAQAPRRRPQQRGHRRRAEAEPPHRAPARGGHAASLGEQWPPKGPVLVCAQLASPGEDDRSGRRALCSPSTPTGGGDSPTS